MVAKGLNPTPLEFYKLVTNDKALTDFFCYCNRNEEFYDFKVVSFDEKNEDEYLTVSARGVVHFLQGEPNFVPIIEWERET
jgi:dynein heavy chain